MIRNRELRRLCALAAALTAAAAAAAGLCVAPAAALPVLGLAAALGILFFRFTRARYRRIAALSRQIDRVLHGAARLDIAAEEEGELAVLQSEIAKMTRRIREQNDALRREKRLLADALADIAHQLRTPLTSANLILPLLRTAETAERRRALGRELETLFGQMDWQLTVLLKLSRLDAGMVDFRREPLPLAELVQEAFRPFRIAMELREAALETDVPADVCILGDRRWLAEALQNVVKNCLDSAGPGGRLTVACRDTMLFTELTVRDNGPGFAPEDLPRLFDRFYRGRAGGGYGLGLALTRSILVRHDAAVSAANHPQGGAVFTFRFPKP